MSSIMEQRKNVLSLADGTVSKSRTLIAAAGMKPDVFGNLLREALLTNPDVVKASRESLALSIKKACMFGLVPNGDQAAITVYNGQANLLPMVSGLQRMAVERLGAEVRAGVIYEGDEVEIVTGSHGESSIRVRQSVQALLGASPDKLVGAWCSIQLPNENSPRVTVLNKHEISAIRAAASQRSPAWKTWPQRMAEKSAIKRGIWSLRHLAGTKEGDQLLFDVVEYDTEAEAGAAPIEVPPEPEVEDPKPIPPKRKPKKVAPKPPPPPPPKEPEPEPDMPPAPPEDPEPPPAPRPRAKQPQAPQAPQAGDGDDEGFLPGYEEDTEL